MALYDEMYQRYGKDFALTPTDEYGLEGAREELQELQDDPEMTPKGDGFVNKRGEFTLNPVTERYIRIAAKTAEAQFWNLPPMPEDIDTAIRFPGIDPEGRTSVIDMKFAQREAMVKAALETRTPEVREYAQTLLDRFTHNLPENQEFIRTGMDMLEVSQQHKVMTRASKLCHSADGRRILHERSRKLETGEAVAKYDLMLQGLEYAAGTRTGAVPEEVRAFYRDTLHTELNMDMVKKAELAHPVERMNVEFEDLDHKLLHQVQANPHNWGKAAWELEAIADRVVIDTVSETVTPYARATADRAISPAFAAQEKATSGILNRADLIIIDGKTVREKMFEDYTASGQDPRDFHQFFRKNYAAATNEYVAAGLMAGKRVEAFIPDKQGRIPDEPTQVTKTGYEPSPLRPEKFNAWQRHFSKYGYYKEKVARQQEYERMTAARGRVRAAAASNELLVRSGSAPYVKEVFFGGWARENGGKLDIATDFSVDRSALHTFAVSRMLMEGHSLEDIYDANALPAEKDAIGREVCQKLKDGDMKWAGETLFHGLRLLGGEIDRRTAGVDFAKEGQMFSRDQTITALAATTTFDICQECLRSCCKDECVAAAEAYAASHQLGQSGKSYFDELHAGVNAAAVYFDFGKKAMRDRPLLAGGMMTKDAIQGCANNMVNFEAAKNSFTAARAAQPDKGMCSLFPKIEMVRPFYGAFAMLQGSSKDFQSFMGRMMKEPQFRRDVGKSLTEGRLQERIKITTDPVKMKGSFKVAPPTGKDDLEVRTPEQLAAQNAPKKQAAAKQQKPPQMGGGRR